MARPRRWDPGTWSGSNPGRPRVLVEATDPSLQWASERVLTAAGYDVTTCGGPDEHGGPCPLVTQGRCEFAAAAHVIVHSFSISGRDNQDVLSALATHHHTTPVIAEIPRPAAAAHRDLLEPHRHVPWLMDAAGLVREVTTALGSGPSTGERHQP